MGLFSKWLGKSQDTAKKGASVDRITAEDMIEQGYTCQEIANSLGCTQDQIYLIKQAKGRREARLPNKATTSIDSDDPVAIAKQDLAATRIQLERDKLEFERRKLEEERKAYFDEGEDEDAPPQDPADLMMATILQGVISRNSPQSPRTPLPPQEITNTNSTQQTQQLQTLSDEQIGGMIDTFVQQYGKKKVLFFARQPDDTLIPILKTQMPGFSEDTYTRALGILKRME